MRRSRRLIRRRDASDRLHFAKQQRAWLLGMSSVPGSAKKQMKRAVPKKAKFKTVVSRWVSCVQSLVDESSVTQTCCETLACLVTQLCESKPAGSSISVNRGCEEQTPAQRQTTSPASLRVQPAFNQQMTQVASFQRLPGAQAVVSLLVNCQMLPQKSIKKTTASGRFGSRIFRAAIFGCTNRCVGFSLQDKDKASAARSTRY